MDAITNVLDTSKIYKIQTTPFFKRLRLRKESDLVHLRQAKEIIENNAKHFLEPQVRQIRLRKLYEHIQDTIEKSKAKLCQRRSTTSTKLNYKHHRVLQAKLKGNEFSKKNCKAIPFSYAFRNALQNDVGKGIKDTSFNKRKEYDQQFKEKQKIELQKNSQTTNKDDYKHQIKNERNVKNEYGRYYSLRNRLSYKQSLKEFDNEYNDLLLQCLLFEREHLDVCGFLEQRQNRSISVIQSKLISNSTYSSSILDIRSDNSTSENDLTFLNSSDTCSSKSKSLTYSVIKQNYESQISQRSKEVFNTAVVTSNRDSDKNNTESSDEENSSLDNNSFSNKQFVWKTKSRVHKTNNVDRNKKNVNYSDLADSSADSQENVVEIQKYASAISAFSRNYSFTKIGGKDNENKNKKDLSSMIAKTSEGIINKPAENGNSNNLDGNVISKQEETCNKSSLTDEISDIFSYGAKIIKDTTNNNIDHNLIKAFALKH